MYEAERLSVDSGHYHRRCFTCTTCHRPLEPATATHSPSNEVVTIPSILSTQLSSPGLQLVCTRCYSRHFGPGGLGQELDISGRYRTDTVKAGPGCPVCHGAVFDAEKVDIYTISEL